MGFNLRLKHKKIKDRWDKVILTDIKWSSHWVINTAEKLGIPDPLSNVKWDNDRQTEGANIILYRGFLQAIVRGLKNKAKNTELTKTEINALEEAIDEAKEISMRIRGKNLNNWYLRYG